MDLVKQFVYPMDNKRTAVEIEALAAKLGISMPEMAILYQRGVNTVEKVKSFIDTDTSNLLDARLMKDAVKAAKIILAHIEKKHHIVVYSDYDADGWGGAIVGKGMMKDLGANVDVFTNNREMGFGMSVKGIVRILEAWPDTKLIVTADNGIVAYEAVNFAEAQGIEVVITDHHQPDVSEILPAASAVVNPHRKDCGYPFKELCGAAVIWKVLSIAFYLKCIPFAKAQEYIDVVSLSTVADVVPLIGENRVIVTNGLRLMSENARIQWKVFKKVFGDYSPINDVDARTVAFSFGPAINAVSRMNGSIQEAIDVFETNDEEEVTKRVLNLKNVNKCRKAVTKNGEERAMVQADAMNDFPVTIVTEKTLFEGIVGLIAGRIRENTNKPCIVLTDGGNGIWRGSGRSIGGFHIKDVLDNIQKDYDVFEAYGGHSQACGLSVKDENLQQFFTAMVNEARKIPEEDFIKKVVIDYEAREDEIDALLVDRIRSLEPYGQRFEEPMIGIRDLVPLEVKTIGSENQHLVLKCKKFDVVSWYGANLIKNEDGTLKDASELPASYTVCGSLQRDNFGIKLVVDPQNIQF